MDEVSLYTGFPVNGTIPRAGNSVELPVGGLEEPCRGTSLIRNRRPPQAHHRALGIGLL